MFSNIMLKSPLDEKFAVLARSVRVLIRKTKVAVLIITTYTNTSTDQYYIEPSFTMDITDHRNLLE